MVESRVKFQYLAASVGKMKYGEDVTIKRIFSNYYIRFNLWNDVVSIISTGFGMNIGWAGPSIVLLTSDETPLTTGKISMEEVSWISAMLPMGGFAGNIFFGCITKSSGRKWPLFYLAFPMIMSWLLVFFAENIYYLYAARLLHGFVAGGVIIVVTLYLIEISNDSIRGVLSSTVTLCGNFGTMLIFIMGTYIDFYTSPLLIIAFTILFAITFYFFPETPSFLMKHNKIGEAEKSTRFYQNLRKAGDCEMLQFVLSVLNQFSGCFAILNYSGIIFKEAGSNFSSHTSMIFVSLIQFIGSLFLIVFVDRAGRKFAYLMSTLGAAFGLITLGMYMMLKSWHWDIESFNWIPLASFSFTIFSASLAILTLPFTVMGEVMPENIKDFGVTFCNALLSFLAIITLKFLKFLTDLFGFHGSMFLFAAICLLSALFITIVMPETKGRSYDQIMKLLE